MEDESKTSQSIAAQLRAVVAVKGILKKDLAEKSGLAVNTLSRYLNGHRDIPVSAFMQICQALGVDPGALLNEAAKDL
ncbi:helix-turn-helix transcriptional regulator [Arthrobacter sp. YC-RL1]|uniref:helix-turn-helix domain-containing protein n=1 Tax=Arthrobacter sp. YC-RL1 TaxID=1652545 RepID=UPI0009E40C98|nr:helix-turn-helix transcriptional regulator [Arthrobacter sp. YC-RL1]